MAAAQTQTPAPRLIPAKRAARELGVPYETLRAAHFRGELPCVRIGASARHAAWYFDRRDLESWVESRKELSA